MNRSDDYRGLLASEYLSPLVDNIAASFPQAASKLIEKRIDDLVLDIKRLYLPGIIINELVTNAMKYTFVGGKDGLLTIRASVSESRHTVTVRDDGGKLPEGFDPEPSGGSGLMLVRGLAQRMQGTFRLDRANGTVEIRGL